MRLTDQVCSFELSRRLKELKVRQNSFFYFYREGWEQPGEYQLIPKTDFARCDAEETISAFTSAEIGDMLPNATMCSKALEEGSLKWFCWNMEYLAGEFHAINEVNAKAKLLIYLLMNHSLKK